MTRFFKRGAYLQKIHRLLEVVDKVYSGPIVDEKEFDHQYVAAGVARVIQKYGLAFDQGRIIQTDDDMVDRTWEAAIDFLVGCGIYHTDTQRLIKFSRDEIEAAVSAALSSVTIGEGADARDFTTRRVEDPRPPLVGGGPIGTPLSEDQYVPIMQSYFQEQILDIVVPGTLTTSYGRQVRARSPLEVIASWQEVDLVQEAAARADRVGLSVMGVEMAMSDLGHLSAISRGGYRPTDTHIVALISEMKTNNDLLNKAAHSLRQEGVILGFYNPILGGLGGGAEGVAILILAGWLAMQLIYMPASVESCPTHPFLANSTFPDIMRAISTAAAATARNSHLLSEFMTSPVSGPGTESLLYECVAMATVVSACGASRALGVRSGVGVVENHCTGLETRFNGQVAHAAAGLPREQADEIVRKAIEKYRPVMDQKPVGIPFSSSYDVENMQPTKEWLGIYERVRENAFGWGLALD
jgi:methylamine--corrinoid protein Co-methyltransferase